jgi:glycine betaine/choline ABC-type transport system substrate-binding protein
MEVRIMAKRYLKKVSFIVISIILVSLAGCSKSKGNGTIKIATKPMTEQLILGEIISLFIEENTDLKVEITKGVGGGTSNIHPALLKGDFDLYPEYTGTGWSFVLKEEGIPDDETLYKELSEKYDNEYKLKWVGLYGFNNTYGLVIRKDIAEKYNIKTYSDLKDHAPELNFGAEYDFYERDDGYNALCRAYDLKFKSASDMDIGLKYKAINSKDIDVMNVFTTDGQLSNSDVVVLKDDKNFYQTYYCGTVVRNDTLEKYKELEEVLMKMDNIINDSEMAKLNYEVETNKKDEREVAKEFLTSKGLLK